MLLKQVTQSQTLPSVQPIQRGYSIDFSTSTWTPHFQHQALETYHLDKFITPGQSHLNRLLPPNKRWPFFPLTHHICPKYSSLVPKKHFSTHPTTFF